MAATNRTQILEALGSYQRQVGDFEDNVALGRMIDNESDRGAVIIFASFVEDRLLERIYAQMVPLTNEQKKRLDRAGGPLNSFTARINFALALGLIDEETAQDLEVLKCMRNACAHSRRDINLLTPELHAAFTLILGGKIPKTYQGKRVTRDAVKIIFVMAATYLSMRVAGYSKEETETALTAVVATMMLKHTQKMKRKASRAKRKSLRLSENPPDPSG